MPAHFPGNVTSLPNVLKVSDYFSRVILKCFTSQRPRQSVKATFYTYYVILQLKSFLPI